MSNTTSFVFFISKCCFCKKSLSLVLTVLLSIAVTAQANKIMLLKNYRSQPAALANFVKKAEAADYDQALGARLLIQKPAALEFSFLFENKEWVIELSRNELFSKAFRVITGSIPSTGFDYAKDRVLHYRGRVKGSKKSFAAISILEDKMVAVIADETGNINIGAINTTEERQTGGHIIYRESNLLIKNEFACTTEDSAATLDIPVPVYRPADILAATVNSEPVDFYFEADYTTFVNNGSDVSNTVNYVTALFNVVHTLYENDSISTKISGIKVWNIADPYISYNNTALVLNSFSANMQPGFPGDLAHLLSQRNLGGGRANINILCGSDGARTGVSGNLTNSFSPVPVYSWSTMVVTHETGHNLGSPHTQSCSWPIGALDNCYPTEGGCPLGPAPANGGTIMSYCHLAAAGINLANGFGPLPGYLVRAKVRNNLCIYPGVIFENTFQNITEESSAIENGCYDYSILTTKLKISYAPNVPTEITVVADAADGLTVGLNKDVEVTPTSFTFDENNLSQLISVKVYNDKDIENTESLILRFNINTNGSNAVKRSYNNIHTVNIYDSDHTPDSTNGVVLFSETFDSVASGLGNWSQEIIYGDNSPNRWMIGNNNDPFYPTKSAYISNNSSSLAYSGSTISDSAVLRLISPEIDASGFTNLQLGYFYSCVGEYNYVIGGGTGQGETLVGNDFGRLYYSADNGVNWTLLKDNIAGRFGVLRENIALPAEASNNSHLKIAFEWVNNTSIIGNPPLVIDSIVLQGTSTAPVQTAAHVSNTEESYVGPNQTVHFYNPATGNIMATIQNKGAFDFGCTKVELVRTGSNASAAWDSLLASKVSDKLYRVTMENNEAAAQYDLTLYYTGDELNGWAAATGNLPADARIVKTNSDLALPAVTATPVFSYNHTVGGYGATPHKKLSGSFSGSGYFALTKLFTLPQCPAASARFGAGIPGNIYQWQVNTGNGYANISNNGVYAGVGSDTLQLTAPTSYYGYQYRCAVNTQNGIIYSVPYTLKFGMTWMGTQSKAWENPLNWGCGVLPDENTDVIVHAGTAFTPEISSSTPVRSLKLAPSANVSVKTGAVLTIKK